jgi:hypothetical protein
MNSLDSILAGRETAPVQETTQEQTTQAVTEQGTEQTTEQTTETTGTGQAAEGGKQPPIGAIRQAEREKATKRYTEQVADFDKKFDEYRVATDRRFEQLLTALKPKTEPQPAPDIFENPSSFVRHEMNEPLTEMRQVLMHNSRLIAEQRHTDEVVQAADAAFTQAYQSGQLDPADYQRVIRSPNIFDAAVKWHKRQQAQAEIGDDPVAYRARVEAEIRAKFEADAQNPDRLTEQPQQRAPVMPSNLAAARNVGSRAGPAWGGPTKMDDIFKR